MGQACSSQVCVASEVGFGNTLGTAVNGSAVRAKLVQPAAAASMCLRSRSTAVVLHLCRLPRKLMRPARHLGRPRQLLLSPQWCMWRPQQQTLQSMNPTPQLPLPQQYQHQHNQHSTMPLRRQNPSPLLIQHLCTSLCKRSTCSKSSLQQHQHTQTAHTSTRMQAMLSTT
jgi:hypothetical protein